MKAGLLLEESFYNVAANPTEKLERKVERRIQRVRVRAQGNGRAVSRRFAGLRWCAPRSECVLI